MAETHFCRHVMKKREQFFSHVHARLLIFFVCRCMRTSYSFFWSQECVLLHCVKHTIHCYYKPDITRMKSYTIMSSLLFAFVVRGKNFLPFHHGNCQSFLSPLPPLKLGFTRKQFYVLRGTFGSCVSFIPPRSAGIGSTRVAFPFAFSP